MKTLLALTIVTLLATATLSPTIAEPPVVEDGPIAAGTQFATIDIAIDPRGNALGAFQFKLTSPDVSFTVVGVEAGEHSAFDHGRPPYFDPTALNGEGNRLVIAEYARPKLKADDLPREPVRVATVHVMFTGPLHEQPTINLTLTAAGDADGEAIDANVSHTLQIPERPE